MKRLLVGFSLLFFLGCSPDGDQYGDHLLIIIPAEIVVSTSSNFEMGDRFVKVAREESANDEDRNSTVVWVRPIKEDPSIERVAIIGYDAGNDRSWQSIEHCYYDDAGGLKRCCSIFVEAEKYTPSLPCASDLYKNKEKISLARGLLDKALSKFYKQLECFSGKCEDPEVGPV